MKQRVSGVFHLAGNYLVEKYRTSSWDHKQRGYVLIGRSVFDVGTPSEKKQHIQGWFLGIIWPQASCNTFFLPNDPNDFFVYFSWKSFSQKIWNVDGAILIWKGLWLEDLPIASWRHELKGTPEKEPLVSPVNICKLIVLFQGWVPYSPNWYAFGNLPMVLKSIDRVFHLDGIISYVEWISMSKYPHETGWITPG